jgi:cation transport regulator ChaC
VGGDAAERHGKRGVILHFAYGSNMHRAVMKRHAPAAQPIGVAELANYRFLITTDGYASVEPRCGQSVHGVLWRLTPRDRVTLDVWESIATGQYRAETLAVRADGRRYRALVYVGRQRSEGTPKAGYMELVIAAARAWDFPARYIAGLEEWLPAGPGAAGSRKLGDFRWM